MKYQIRNSVFETNSSSAHSIVVTNNDVHVKPEEFSDAGYGPERIYINSDGNWEIAWDEEDLSFGRYPMKLLTTVEDKVRYVFADYCGEYCDYSKAKLKAEEIISVLKKIIPGLTGVTFPEKTAYAFVDDSGNLLDSNISVHSDWVDGDQTYYYIKDGEKITVYPSYDYYFKKNYYGYVDHQSQGLIDNFLKKNNISLEEFLINRKYVICIDGDEYNFWEKFKYSGLINVDNIIEEFSGSNENNSYIKSSDED